MTRNEFLKHLEETKRILMEEADELTDYAKYKAVVCIESAMDYIQENEERDW